MVLDERTTIGAVLSEWGDGEVGGGWWGRAGVVTEDAVTLEKVPW